MRAVCQQSQFIICVSKAVVVGLHLCAYYYFIWVVSLIPIICKTWMHMRWNPYLNLISLLFCDLLVQTSFGFILAASPFSISFFFRAVTLGRREMEICAVSRSSNRISARPRNRPCWGWKYFRSPARRERRGHMEIEIFPDMCFYLAARPAIVFMDYLIKFAMYNRSHPDGGRASLFSAFRWDYGQRLLIQRRLWLLRAFLRREGGNFISAHSVKRICIIKNWWC